ncbi:MAG: nucleoside triphosphate pyrophosphohydrolase [Alphaproteobacteria bacterium]
MKPSPDITRLLEVMAALRTPGTGCPWDLEQNFQTIAPYTIEEAHEVADAISRGDLDDLKDELGDLLLQVVFHARMAEEQGSFAFGDVVQAITEKLIRRHPHVFGDKGGMSTPEVTVQWDKIKAQEKEAKKVARAEAGKGPALVDSSTGRSGALSGVSAGLPALARALKLQQKAGKVGFDWNDPKAVIDKIREETSEIEAELDNGDTEHAKEEIGDLLFVVVNLAHHLGVDPETALRGTNLKFERRFGAIEDALAALGKTPEQATLAEMDALWDQAKAKERAGK